MRAQRVRKPASVSHAGQSGRAPAGGPVTPDVLERFVAERADRAARIVRQSRLFGRIGHVRNPVAVRLRDAMMRRMGGGDQEEANGALMRWQPPSGPVAVG